MIFCMFSGLFYHVGTRISLRVSYQLVKGLTLMLRDSRNVTENNLSAPWLPLIPLTKTVTKSLSHAVTRGLRRHLLFYWVGSTRARGSGPLLNVF